MQRGWTRSTTLRVKCRRCRQSESSCYYLFHIAAEAVAGPKPSGGEDSLKNFVTGAVPRFNVEVTEGNMHCKSKHDRNA